MIDFQDVTNAAVEVPMICSASSSTNPWVSIDGRVEQVSLAHVYASDDLRILERSGTAPSPKGASVLLLVDGIPVRVLMQDEPSNTEPIENVVSVIGRIRERLDLSVTQLAELFGVTRKSIYDWYDGALPRDDKLSKMAILDELLSSVEPGRNLSSLKAFWNIDSGNGSLISLFRNESLDDLRWKASLAKKIDELSSRMVASRNLAAPISSVKTKGEGLTGWERQT